MTSNFGAIGFSNADKNSITTEAYWTDELAKGLSAYEKSKLIAEKEAWKFMENETELEFATINWLPFWSITKQSCLRKL